MRIGTRRYGDAHIYGGGEDGPPRSSQLELHVLKDATVVHLVPGLQVQLVAPGLQIGQPYGAFDGEGIPDVLGRDLVAEGEPLARAGFRSVNGRRDGGKGEASGFRKSPRPC